MNYLLTNAFFYFIGFTMILMALWQPSYGLNTFAEKNTPADNTPIKEQKDIFTSINPLQSAYRNPFNSPWENNNHLVEEKKLTDFSISTLMMIGNIQFENKIFALVKTPDNTVYPITANDHLGKERWKVINITKNAINIMQNHRHLSISLSIQK